MPSILPINIDDLLRLRSVESARVEFKASWDEEWTGAQVPRTICAFANDVQNLNGGYIVIGVEAPDGVARLPPVGLDASTVDMAQRWIRGNCQHIEPDYHPILSPEVMEGRHLLVVWAPASDNRKAHGDHPASSILAAALIRELARDGDLLEAQHIYDEFVARPDRDDSASVSVAMAQAYADAGHMSDASAVLDQIPSLLSAHEAIDAAIVERRAGRQQQAHEYFARAGDAVFRDVRALHEFAQTKLALARSMRLPGREAGYKTDARLKLLRDVRDMLRRVLQMGAPPTRQAWAWFDLGRVLRELQAPQTEIREAFERARQLLPSEDRFRGELDKLT